MTNHNDAIERAVGRLPADMDMMDVEHIRPILRDLVAEVESTPSKEMCDYQDRLARIVELCEEGLLDGEIVVLAEDILAIAREGQAGPNQGEPDSKPDGANTVEPAALGGEQATPQAANVSTTPTGSVEVERAPAAPDLRELIDHECETMRNMSFGCRDRLFAALDRIEGSSDDKA